MESKILTYTVIFEKDEARGYVATVPTLPGCMTQAETFEEARELIRDAIKAYLAVLKEDGDEIPVESPEHIAATVTVPISL